jgi:YVTN family beta-propeller protein
MSTTGPIRRHRRLARVASITVLVTALLVLSPAGLLSRAGATPAPNTLSYVDDDTLAVGAVPIAMALDPAAGLAYTADLSSNELSIINVATSPMQLVGTVAVGSSPVGVAVDPGTHTVYVTNESSASISVIQAGVVTATIALPGILPAGVAVDPSSHTVYAVDAGTPTRVAVIQAGVLVHVITLTGDQSQAIVLDPALHLAYVSHADDGTVSQIDTTTNTQTAVINVSTNAYGMALDSATHTLYVSNVNNGKVFAVDSGVVTALPAGFGASANDNALFYDQSSDTLFSGAGSIESLHNGVITTSTAGTTTYAIAYDPLTKELFSTHGFSANSVTAIGVLTTPKVTTQPINRAVTAGGSATFSTAASGAPAPSVQWQSSTDGVTFAAIAGATSTTLTISNVALSANGTRYRAVFTNAGGPNRGTATDTSAAAVLTVTAAVTTTTAAVTTTVLASTGPRGVNALTTAGIGLIITGWLALLGANRRRRSSSD